MKKKQIRQLCILIAVLLLLVAGYAALRFWNARSERLEQEAEEAAVIRVELPSDITSVTISNPEGTNTYVGGDEVWNWAEDAAFPLNSSYIENLLTELGDLTAERTLEDADTMEAYGLEQPEYSVTVRNADGEEACLSIGGTVGDENVYARVNEEETVYLLDLGIRDYLEYDLYDMALCESVPVVSSSTLLTLEIDGGEQSVVITKTTETDEEGAETDIWTTADGEDITDADNRSELISEITGFTFDGMVNYSSSEEERDAAGLTEPAYEIRVDFEGGSFTLQLGDYTDDTHESLYASMNNGKKIYTVSLDKVETVVNLALTGTDSLYSES